MSTFRKLPVEIEAVNGMRTERPDWCVNKRCGWPTCGCYSPETDGEWFHGIRWRVRYAIWRLRGGGPL